MPSSLFTPAFLPLALALTLPALAVAAPLEHNSSQLPADAADRKLLSVTPPACFSSDCWTDGVEPNPQGVGLRIVYLNFEGVTLTSTNTQPDDATTNRTWMMTDVVPPGSSLTIPAFDPNDLGSLSEATSRQQIIDYTLAEMQAYHQSYNIQFTTARPSSGTYHMVVFGGSCAGVIGSNCAGIAPLDCNDFSPSNIVFAFPAGLRAVDLAPTATQEMAHAFGLSHTLDNTDFMYPQIQGTLPTHYGAGAIPNEDQGPCGNGNFQDSHEKLLSIVGFPGQDTVPPSVLITSPSNGDIVKIGDSVSTNITDNNPIAKVELLLNNSVVATDTSLPFEFNVPASAPLGQVFLDVRASDVSGNEAEHRVTVYIGTGDEEPCVNGECDEGFTCTENLCFADTPQTSGVLGDVCVLNEDCETSTCAEVAGELRCSQSCNAENLCPDGFECLGDTACWPLDDSGDDDGFCSIAKPGRGALSSIGLLLIAIVMVGRRRRSPTNRRG